MSIRQAVAKAVYAKLAADLAPVLVFDHVPADQAYPFVEISRHLDQPDDTLAEHGSVHLVYLSVWSSHRGRKEANGIVDQIRAALHHQPLALDEGEAILVEVIDTDAVRDADGITYQGAATVRLRVGHED